MHFIYSMGEAMLEPRLHCSIGGEINIEAEGFNPEIIEYLEKKVEIVIAVDIARAFADLNRTVSDRPPKNPDGVVKTHTCFNQPIFKNGFILDKNLIEIIINRYYEPYHKRIRDSMQRFKIKLALDCHSIIIMSKP